MFECNLFYNDLDNEYHLLSDSVMMDAVTLLRDLQEEQKKQEKQEKQ